MASIDTGKRRRLVHAALAPKHVAKVQDGKEVQYKLLGLGDLHHFDEASHARLVDGVREYASPEAKIAGHPLDASADLYSVAMMLFAEVAGTDRLPPLIDPSCAHAAGLGGGGGVGGGGGGAAGAAADERRATHARASPAQRGQPKRCSARGSGDGA